MPAVDPRPLRFVLNGRAVSVEGAPVSTTALDYFRQQGLTGAKEGCAEGECGACTVVVVAARGQKTAYLPVNSCLLLLPMLDGQEVYTVEALAQKGELAEAQHAMASMGGSQCGYCTPGFVMSLFAEQYRPGRTGACDVHQLGGNLCRCSAYRAIRDAAHSLGPPPAGAFLDRLAKPAPQPVPFAYSDRETRFSRPTSLAECFDLAGEDPEARWISGATDMGVESNLRYRRWKHLISLEAVPELGAFENLPNRVRIGAGLPLEEIAARWHDAPQIVREWLHLFASPTLRNRATLGGNLSTASPIGDGPPLLIALDATVHVAGPQGSRAVPIDAFFPAYRRTALDAGELIAAIEIPTPVADHSRFYKIAKRNLDDISTVAAAFTMEFGANGNVEQARFGFGGVAATPLRAHAAEQAALGRPWNIATVERVQAELDRELHPISDHRGSAGYRLEVAKSLVKKFWWETRS